MRVPIDWLKELVNFRAGGDQLAEMLSLGGLEAQSLPEEVLEVDILPNRADALSIRGIAREVSALTKFKLRPIKFKIKETGGKISQSLKVEVRDSDLCPRYMARVIENVKIVDSPEWLKKRLEKAGIRPINNAVDVTNYLLHEIGQPMHAFDADLIADRQIIVRRAGRDEKVKLIDGKEYILNTDTLVIADSEKVIACAGVMGAGNTEVNPTTQTIILESAFFDPISIHQTSKRLKLRSESSIRFEHGVDWNGVEEALDRGAALIGELCRGSILNGRIDIKAKTPRPKTVDLRLDRMGRILGQEIPAGDAISILKRLGFGVKQQSKSILKVTIPLFRAMDVEREIDLIEEISRIYGYGRINSTMPDTAFPGKQLDKQDFFHSRIRHILAGCGLNEAQSYSMLGPADFESVGIPLERTIKISNPLTVEESIMRTHILPGLLKAAAHNQNRQVANLLLFEIGKVFSDVRNKMPEEKWMLGAVVSGSPFMSALDKGEVDYFYIKGIVENLLNSLGIKLPNFKETSSYLVQPGKAAAMEGIGILGALHPAIQRNFELDKPVYFFEIDLDQLFKLSNKELVFKPLPKFPAVSRDISMFLPEGLENQAIIALIREVGGELVETAFPFDQYKDSRAYRIVYRDQKRTLTEEEVNSKTEEIVNYLTTRLQVKIRQ